MRRGDPLRASNAHGAKCAAQMQDGRVFYPSACFSGWLDRGQPAIEATCSSCISVVVEDARAEEVAVLTAKGVRKVRGAEGAKRFVEHREDRGIVDAVGARER